MELEEFQSNCNSKKCLKQGNRFDSKTCVRTSKQINCHKAYERLEQKRKDSYKTDRSDRDEQYEFDNEVWIRDTGESKGETSTRENWKRYCRIWAILTPDEKQYVESNFDGIWSNETLDIAHIRPKSTAIKDKKNIENVVLIGRGFHRRLTDLEHPITGKPILNNEAVLWLESARDRKRKIF